MKKLWKFLAVFFVGLSAGLLVAVKTAGDTYKVGINKLKQKGRGNTQESDLDVNLIPQTQPVSRFDRKFKRKQGKIIKRNLKNQRKAEKRLENNINLN